MSKIGKQPVKLESGVSFERRDSVVKITGPKGSIEIQLPKSIDVEENEGGLSVISKGKGKFAHSLHGTLRSNISNAAKGVIEGWQKTLELVGTGYRAEISGNTLVLTVGFSHPIKVDAPQGIVFRVVKTDVFVEGADKHLVGQIAAKIRAIRPPEPYKGKGIKYKDETIRRKAGKAAKTEGTGA